MKLLALDEIATFVSGGTPLRNRSEFWSGTIPWIKTGSINYCWIREADEFITELGLKKSAARIVPKGTILMALYGQGKTRGQVGILGIDAAVNQACLAIVLKKGYDRNYIYQQLVFRYRSIRRLSNSGGQDNLSSELVREIVLPIPGENEQRELGIIFNTCDLELENLENLISAKKNHLRGLRQLLLTGTARFKAFENKSWRTVRIGSLFKECNRYFKWSDDEAYRFASLRRRSGGLFDRGTFLGREVKTKVLKSLKAGDFLISKRQVVHGAWAMVTKSFDGFGVSDEYDVLVNRDPKSLDMRFFNYLTQTRELWHKAYLASNGVHIEKLIFDFEDFAKEKVRIPPTVEEQFRIVDLLSTCDREIELLQKQLAVLKQQKQGLMQKLLTGAVRVKTIEEAA